MYSNAIQVKYGSDGFSCENKHWFENLDQIGESPFVEVSCNPNFHGSSYELINIACQYLSSLSDQFEVSYLRMHTEESGTDYVSYLCFQIRIITLYN